MSKLIFFTITVAALLSGCGTITPGGLIAASRLDPLETSPSNLTFAVSVPETLRLRDGDAELELAFLPDGKTPDQSVAVNVPLSLRASPDGPRQAIPGETIYVLSLAPKAAAQVAVWQGQVKALRARGIEGKGSLGIGMAGGCLIRPLTDAFPFATWIRTDASADYVQLTHSTDLFEVLDADELDLFKKGLAPC